MSAPDPRLADEGVQVARRANWLVGDDPAPEYSDWDARDGLTADVVLPRPVPARERVEFGPVLPEPPHTMYGPMKVAGVLLFGIVCFVLGGLAVWAIHLMAVAS